MSEADPPWIEQPLFEMPAQPSSRRQRRGSGTRDDPREFGGWTLDKLTILEKYFKMYRRVAGSGTYIDAFAGEGAARIRGNVVPSSGLIALESDAFRQLFLVELNPGLATRLEARVAGHRRAKRCNVIVGDCNAVIVEQLLNQRQIDESRPCFAFLDPDSTQLAWSTVQALAEYKVHDPNSKQCKIELWILFNEYQAIQRLWPRNKAQLPPFADVLDKVMGGRESWLDLWQARRGPQWLVGRYRERLLKLGYQTVHLQQIIDPATSRAQYWMIHATDHAAAVTFMRWAKRSSSIALHNEPFPGFDDV